MESEGLSATGASAEPEDSMVLSAVEPAETGAGCISLSAVRAKPPGREGAVNGRSADASSRFYAVLSEAEATRGGEWRHRGRCYPDRATASVDVPHCCHPDRRQAGTGQGL